MHGMYFPAVFAYMDCAGGKAKSVTLLYKHVLTGSDNSDFSNTLYS